MKKIIAVLLIVVVSCVQANDVGEISAHVKIVLKSWIDRNRPLVNSLLARDAKLADYQAKHFENMALLQQKWLRNYSGYNYIFELSELPGYMLKISSLPCRFANVLAANDSRQSDFADVSAEERNKIYAEFKMVPTYQTASYWNTYQLYGELGKKTELHYVRFPRTYVFKLMDSEPMHDQNCIIVQEKMALVDEKTEHELLGKLGDEQLKELVTVIGACGLWNLKSNIKFDADGHIVIVSLEQPNVSNPLTGFNQKDLDRFMKNVQSGINELTELFEGDEHRQQLIQQSADPIIDRLYEQQSCPPVEQ